MTVPLHGQLAVSGAAQPLNATPLEVAFWVLKAPATNAHTVFFGRSSVTTANGHALDPGESFAYQVENRSGEKGLTLQPSDLYVVGTSPDVVTWLANP